MWHELQLPLPLNRLYPAISSAVNVYVPARKASNFDVNGLTSFDLSKALSDCPQRSKTMFARVRPSGFRLTGVVSVPNTAAPPGVAQIFSVFFGNVISSTPWPHTCSKRGRYVACDSRK